MLSYTIDQAANRIATSGWTNASSVPVTYAFRSSDSSTSEFVRFNAAQIAATQQALALWSDVANIKFTRVGSSYSNSASILFGGDATDGGYAWAYFPGSRLNASVDGDVYINPSNGWFKDLSAGSYDFMTIVHEIGHAIGLDHPGDYDGGNPTYTRNAGYVQDTIQYTVMSYFDAESTGARHDGIYAATPLLHDIAAVQKIYGINWSTRVGNTVYGFNSNANRSQFDLDSASDKAVFAIWDGGGNDTLDFSGYSQNATIDLAQMAFSSVGGLTKNVAIARYAVIENAVGGSGHDIISGNAAANKLIGGSGNDTLRGFTGNDILTGGHGADAFIFDTVLSATANVDRITDFYAPADTIRLENAIFKALGTATGFLTAGRFYAGAKAHDADDRIVYNRVSGDLFYDADGSGAAQAIKFAILAQTVKPVLSAADFLVV